MATIVARATSSGRKRFQAQIRRKGLPTLVQTFSSRTLAKEWAKKVEAEVASSRFLRRVEEERHDVSEAIDRYLREHLELLAESEQANRESKLEWWRRQLGAYSLAALSPSLIADSIQLLLRSVSGATANRYLAALSAVLDRAEKDWEWLDHNPARRVRRRPETRGRVRFLSDGERISLLEACQRSAEARLYPLVFFALATGARQGELLGLRWRDIDVPARRASLLHTKNGDRRSISFPGRAGQLLEDLSAESRSEDFVFANPHGQPTFPRKPWLRALEAAEVEDFRFHDLRHTAASYLAMSGATLPELAAFLGHRTLAMVQRYAHLTDAHSASVAQRMSERFLDG